MIDVSKLRQHVEAGIVYERRHPTLPIAIYNYSPQVQYDRLWDEVTLQTRGLILYGETPVARPFRKFFNDTEHGPDEIPWHLPCEATEKLDGSLLIAFNFNGGWNTATRGSFESEQAIRGGEILGRMDAARKLDPSITYLWEVIYPENRIVVNYGSRRECVLLAMIETATGRELSLDDAPAGVPVVRRLPPDASVRELRTIIRDDEEGYVIRFANGFRVKVKGDRYMQLHRIITGISSRTIWESLSKGDPIDSILDVAPDECGEWIRSERTKLMAEFDSLKSRAKVAYSEVAGMPDRKSQALHLMANHRESAPAVFLMLDGKSIDGSLWKRLYPEFRRPEVADRIEA